MGCRKFRNYKHILHVSRNGEYVDGGEFPPSLGSFAIIPKAKRGKQRYRSRYRYFFAVHMDIAFGDCLSVGGFRYALILVDCATWFNWTFGLKSFHWSASWLPFASFERRLVLLPVVTTVTVMQNCLGLPSPSISLTTAPRLSLLLLNANLRTVSSNLIGR
jgi:hypothetical protein